LILEKTVNNSRSDWPTKINEIKLLLKILWKCLHIKWYYGKSCQLPVDLEHKARYVVKQLNFEFKTASEKRVLVLYLLDEWRNEAYESAKLFKKRLKFGMIRKLEGKKIKVGNQVLLFNSRFKFSADKLASRW
jgi:hypothetical protein